jgi:predicted DNA-binding transcriptional regulator YafY
MTAPVYVRRFQRVTRTIDVLSHYPDGRRLADLAAELDTSEGVLREEILAYYAADATVDELGGGYREPVIEFVADPDLVDGGDDDVDPADAPYLRLRDMRPAAEVGTQFLSLGQLAQVSRAGHDLLTLDPDNTVLAEAVEALETTILAGLDPDRDGWLATTAQQIRSAIGGQRRVRIRYARTWTPGVVEHEIEPYRLVHTRRGWEVDAGVVGRHEYVPTFLLSGIREIDILEETFQRPADVDERIEHNRREVAVTFVVPQDARWIVERHAESAEVLDEDEESVKLLANVLPPVQRRVGLVLLIAGPDAFVTEPEDLRDTGSDLARELLAHHAH